MFCFFIKSQNLLFEFFFRILIVKDKNVQFTFFGKVVFQIILGLKYNKNFSKIHFVQRGGGLL